MKIVQFNTTGLPIDRLVELKRFLDIESPEIVCIQESHLSPGRNFSVKNYTSHRKDRVLNSSSQKGGGLLTLVRKDLISSVVNIDVQSSMEILVIKVEMDNLPPLSVVNIYINKPSSFNNPTFKKLLDLSPNQLILGDFNLHHPLWDSTHPRDPQSLLLLDSISISQISHTLITPKNLGTYVHSSNGKNSTIDLCFVGSRLSAYSKVSRFHDNLGSQHYPLITELSKRPVLSKFNIAPRWIFNDDNWKPWALKLGSMVPALINDIDVLNENITKSIIDASNLFFKLQTQLVKNRKKNVHFWNNNLESLKQNKCNARKIWLSDKSNLFKKIEMRKAEATFKKHVLAERKAAWEDICENQFNQSTPSKTLWKNFRKFAGYQHSDQSTPKIKSNGGSIMYKPYEVAESLNSYFAGQSSNSNTYNNSMFMEAQFPPGSVTNLDKDFDMDVLTSTIQSLNDSAMGEDLVHNKMLRALPPTFLVPLLYLFNRCWESGTVPSAWKSSILVPIYKGKGDRSDPASYRPIALTSCIAKLYEKMIKLRFEPLIDNSLIAEQAGFRKGRSTLDNLIQLDHDIKKAFTRKRVVSAVFFDIKKAYDTLDPFAILRQAHKFNVGNNFWKWCRAMLFNRTIKTRVGSICSSASTVSLGVPQGGVLSPLLFNILINDIILADMPSIKFVLYADDLALWTEGSSPEACQPKLQGAIDKLSIWLNTKNLVFSIPKTTGMVFSRKIDLRQDCLSINLTLYKQQIHFARNVKFLGMWLDSKLNWNDHISHLCDALEKRLNFMRAVAGQKWGASRDGLQNYSHL